MVATHAGSIPDFFDINRYQNFARYSHCKQGRLQDLLNINSSLFYCVSCVNIIKVKKMYYAYAYPVSNIAHNARVSMRFHSIGYPDSGQMVAPPSEAWIIVASA